MSAHKQKQIVLVTGSNKGIGFEIVKKLSSDRPSDRIHILLASRSKDRGEEALRTLGSLDNVSAVQLDVTDDASINKLQEHIASTYGRLDVLINNAGIGNGSFQADWSVRKQYQTVFETNVFGPAVITEKFTDLLDKSSLPKVIFVSSQLGSINDHLAGFAFVKAPAYSSSKAAVNYHAAYFHRLHPTWRVNAVCPGYNATDMTGEEKTEDLDPKNGALRVCELALDNAAGRSGTFSNRFGDLPW